MANIEFGSLDIGQGFNFQKDAQFPVGYIYSLKIGAGSGETATPSNLNIELPDGTGKKAVFAVLSSMTWAGGHGDPIIFEGCISAQNKAVIELLRHKKLSSTQLKIQFIIFDYDPVQFKYFNACSAAPPDSNPVLDGLIQKDGNNLNISVEAKEDTVVVSPKNFKFKIGIMPAPNEQGIFFATAIDHNVVKAWGITVGAAT
jgi:hypothetical protein